MNTQLLKVTEKAITRAAALLRSGELVAFPTETVYGLGADALNGQAVRRIFEVKGRPSDNPLIVHVYDGGQAEAFAAVQNHARELMEAFWPGPLTLVLPRLPHVPDAVTAGLQSVAVRCPAHDGARRLLKRFGGGVAAPSANLSGHVSPTTAEHVYADLNGRILLILDGGPCAFGLESTVLSLLQERPMILRPGSVTKEQIQEIAGPVDIADSVLQEVKEGVVALSPGMTHKHYTPRTPVCVVGANNPLDTQAIYCKMADLARDMHSSGKKNVLIGYAPLKDFVNTEHCVIITVKDDVALYAAQFYALLREADACGADIIYVQAVPAQGVGLALMNRALRAAAFATEDI